MKTDIRTTAAASHEHEGLDKESMRTAVTGAAPSAISSQPETDVFQAHGVQPVHAPSIAAPTNSRVASPVSNSTAPTGRNPVNLRSLPPELHAAIAQDLHAVEIAALENLTYGPGNAPLLWEHVAERLKVILAEQLPEKFDARQILFRGLAQKDLDELPVERRQALIEFLAPFAAEVKLFHQVASTEGLQATIDSCCSRLLHFSWQSLNSPSPENILSARREAEYLRICATALTAIGEASRAIAERTSATAEGAGHAAVNAPLSSPNQKAIALAQIAYGRATLTVSQTVSSILAQIGDGATPLIWDDRQILELRLASLAGEHQSLRSLSAALTQAMRGPPSVFSEIRV